MITPTVGFWELKIVDLSRAQAFYTAAFNLTASPFNGYVMLSNAAGVPIAGLEQVEVAPATDGFFRPTFDSDDLEEDLARVEALGGSIAVSRQPISPEYGWWAAALDPFGNRLQFSTSTPAG